MAPAEVSTGIEAAPILQTIDDPAGINDANVRKFLELWFADMQAGHKPDKSFLDPLRLRFLLGSLSLLEVQHSPLRFRYRLVGTDIVERLGIELTGVWLDEHPIPDIRAMLLDGVNLLYREAKPVYGRLQARAQGQDWALELVGVPLFDSTGRVAYIGAGQSFPPDRSAIKPPSSP